MVGHRKQPVATENHISEALRTPATSDGDSYGNVQQFLSSKFGILKGPPHRSG